MKTYTFGFNQPGYLPDEDPIESDNFDDAQSICIDELENAGDIAANSDDADAANDCEAAKEVAEQWRANDGPHWLTYCDGYAYWIEERDE